MVVFAKNGVADSAEPAGVGDEVPSATMCERTSMSLLVVFLGVAVTGLNVSIAKAVTDSTVCRFQIARG